MLNIFICFVKEFVSDVACATEELTTDFVNEVACIIEDIFSNR